jgi:lysyl-tRNA synthetase class 2
MYTFFMASLEELRDERLQKLKRFEEQGGDGYPAHITLSGTRISSHEVKEKLTEGVILTNEVLVAGRVMSKRGQGKIFFVDMLDEKGKLQLVFKIDTLGEESLASFSSLIDNGDFIAVKGVPFITQRGEKSVEVKEWQLLTKALLPIPTMWYGLENEEEAIRKRYLDFVLNSEKRELFYKKMKFWHAARSFFVERGFLEVETPTIETTTGGAEARPFITHHNDLEMDVYMRICVGELWQKRLMAAGFEKTFEIGRAYRNEGSSPHHLQEFTNLEFYMAYSGYEEGMKMVRDLYIRLAQDVFGTTTFTVNGFTFDLAEEWKVIDYGEEILRVTGVAIEKATTEEIQKKLEELKVSYEGTTRERMLDSLWKHCRKQIAGPAFLVGHPTLVSPLSKKVHGTDKTERFQPIIAGTEVGNGFSELNDPRDQRARFELQAQLIAEGDKEAMMPDMEFVEMLEHGMPPTCGFGFGERLFSILAGLPIRETQLFPLTKMKG